MTQRFPFLDHFNCSETALVERWRGEWADASILHAALHPLDPCRHTMPMWREIALSGISPDRLSGYFRRNPRSVGAAA